LGPLNTATFVDESRPELGVTLKYGNAKNKCGAHLLLTCGIGRGAPVFIEKIDDCLFFFEWHTDVMCVDKPPPEREETCVAVNEGTGDAYDLSGLQKDSGNWRAIDTVDDGTVVFDLNICRPLAPPPALTGDCGEEGVAGCIYSRDAAGNLTTPQSLGFATRPHYDDGQLYILTRFVRPVLFVCRLGLCSSPPKTSSFFSPPPPSGTDTVSIHLDPSHCNPRSSPRSCHQGSDCKVDGKSHPLSARIDFTCDVRAGSGHPLLLYSEGCEYFFVWRTALACPVKDQIGSQCKVTDDATGQEYDFSSLQILHGEKPYSVHDDENSWTYEFNLCGSLDGLDVKGKMRQDWRAKETRARAHHSSPARPGTCLTCASSPLCSRMLGHQCWRLPKPRHRVGHFPRRHSLWCHRGSGR
jgi:insulin-like growth factor 2 receptor